MTYAATNAVTKKRGRTKAADLPIAVFYDNGGEDVEPRTTEKLNSLIVEDRKNSQKIKVDIRSLPPVVLLQLAGQALASRIMVATRRAEDVSAAINELTDNLKAGRVYARAEKGSTSGQRGRKFDYSLYEEACSRWAKGLVEGDQAREKGDKTGKYKAKRTMEGAVEFTKLWISKLQSVDPKKRQEMIKAMERDNKFKSQVTAIKAERAKVSKKDFMESSEVVDLGDGLKF